MIRAAGLLAAGWLTLSAAQAGIFAPPESCTLEMTVQYRGCAVGQHYRCSNDAPGDQWVLYYDTDGARFMSRIDKETRWMESTNLRSGLRDELEPGAKDDASFSTLIGTGRDDFDFWTRSNSGERLHNIGEDRLTGESTMIDGVELELTEFELSVFAEDGKELIRSKGRQFISREHGRFYGGVETAADWTGESREDNDSPVTFAFPGEPGFGSTEPVFDCDLQMVMRLPAEGASS
ncbi:MAG: hypothetical protein ACK5LJ_02840 [Paracoccus sp. (in: a-proteobacteria)]